MSRVEPPLGDSAASVLLENGEAICLFAFVEALGERRRPPPDDATEPRLALVSEGSVAALIGVAPVADYCGGEAERHLSDVAWLAPRVRRHAELVEWAMQESAVFPAPFGTLYSSIESLGAFMRAHQATILNFLRLVADKEEWELRAGAQFDSPEILDRLASRAWPGWLEISKGARYLRLCRDRNALLDFGRAEALALVDDLVAELRPLAAAIRRQAAGGRSNMSGAEPLARYAFLAQKTAVASLRQRVREFAERAPLRHVAITLSGPWAPFSFRPDLTSPK